jgi:hypothetical protein
MRVREAEPPHPLVVAPQAEHHLVVAERVAFAQAFDSHGDDAAALHPPGRVWCGAASRGIQPIDAIDERGIRLGIRFDEQIPHVRRHAIRQRAHSLRGRHVQQIAARERRSVDDRHARSEGRLAIEIESDRHERDACARALGAERHACRARPERRQPACRVADAFRKDADDIPGSE